MNKYLEMKNRHQQEVNDFHMFFAFSDKQFAEGMARFGLKPDQTDMIYRFGYTGGFYLKSDAEKLYGMFERHNTEMKEAIAADPTGDNFIFDMFLYELQNHEYCITRELEDTLDALGMTEDEVLNDPRLLHGLKRAEKIARREE